MIQTLTNINESQKQKDIQIRKKKPILEWLPLHYEELYQSTDLEYSYCLKLFLQIEAAKRDDIPEATMRQWFLEFIRMKWTKEMVKNRYDALIRNPKYGAVDVSDWVNAVQTFAEDEVRVMVKQRIEKIIQRGKYLLANKDKFLTLTDEDKKAIDVGIAKEVEFELRNEKFRLIDEYRAGRKEELKKIKDQEINNKLKKEN